MTHHGGVAGTLIADARRRRLHAQRQPASDSQIDLAVELEAVLIEARGSSSRHQLALERAPWLSLLVGRRQLLAGQGFLEFAVQRDLVVLALADAEHVPMRIWRRVYIE